LVSQAATEGKSALRLTIAYYYRTRWGASGSADYRLNSGSSLAVRGLYSTFRNWGQKWVYTLNDGDVPAASMDWRRPDYAVGNLVASGHHTVGSNWLTWDVSSSRSRMLQSGGNGGAKFKWNSTAPNCVDDPQATRGAIKAFRNLTAGSLMAGYMFVIRRISPEYPSPNERCDDRDLKRVRKQLEED
jgi:hypothetical protein